MCVLIRAMLSAGLVAALVLAACCRVSIAAGRERETVTVLLPEGDDINDGLRSWTVPEIRSRMSGTVIGGDNIRRLYRDFNTLVKGLPESPGSSPEGGEALRRALEDESRMGRDIHNLILAMKEEDYLEYGRFFILIREVLFLDTHMLLPQLISGRQPNRFWYYLRDNGLKQIEKEYLRIAIESWAPRGGSRGSQPGENGYGSAALPDGSTYEGYFENGLFNRRGKRTWDDGHVYVGEYRDGLPHGYGVESWPDGTRYEGQFRSGKWDGKGILVWKDGNVYEGLFKNGEPVSADGE